MKKTVKPDANIRTYLGDVKETLSLAATRAKKLKTRQTEYYDATPENRQSGERYAQIIENIDTLGYTLTLIYDAIEQIDILISKNNRK